MKHARPDYNRIQDPENIIPADEPVFLIRAKDKAGPAAVRDWAGRAFQEGADDKIINAALQHATLMEQWQKEHGSQIPDMP
jgi:hypothetical protein